MPAPAPSFSVGSKTIAFPEDASRLPGLSPAAVDAVLTIIGKYAVDPQTVDIVAANMAQAKFAVEVSAYSVAETLRRMDRGEAVEPYLVAVKNDADFEVVAEAFALVVKRNPKVFSASKAAPAEAPAGN